ncbi:MAG: FimV/HubP family polar landmark protein, partial [Rubrivivax sp.]|nr:FimV/HubP family polar landmark protein [Rubrivivax sp.]
AAAAPAAAQEPGLLASLLENPLVLPAAGVLVALLAGLGIYRLRGRGRKPAGETSFLESRLQPDSFFGASGGQRIDTREATAGSAGSSMSYSLSQLDAIGDVDPVAEADVYLAYGRDLQAEEILKEAMRGNPDRMAIRTKLLEVYAKRRDAKGYELLATQVYSLTHGTGEDWAKAQEMGRQLDPENPLYQPGSEPDLAVDDAGDIVEPLGASTMPHTAKAAPPAFEPAEDATLSGGLDLDLDLSADATPAPERPESANEATQALQTGAEMGADNSLDFDLPDDRPSAVEESTRPGVLQAAASARADDGLDFDLGDLDQPAAAATAAAPAPAAEPDVDFGDFGVGQGAAADADGPIDADDPLARKLELADEFRQIGDLEGARDLLEEVIAKAQGGLRTKAQGMLDSLE